MTLFALFELRCLESALLEFRLWHFGTWRVEYLSMSPLSQKWTRDMIWYPFQKNDAWLFQGSHPIDGRELMACLKCQEWLRIWFKHVPWCISSLKKWWALYHVSQDN
jgi:hypothetical protein